MKKAPIILSFLLAILLTLIPSTLTHAYNLKQIIDKDRLSNSCVVSLCQDQSGLLWIGTIDGINSYNGREVRPLVYDHNKKELSGSVVNDIIETEDGQLWITAYYGLNSYNKHTNQLTSYFEGNIHMDKDTQNTLFVVRMDNKVLYFPCGGKDFVELQDIELEFDSIVNMIINADGEMLVFYKNGTIQAYRIEYKNKTPELNLIYQYEHKAAIKLSKRDGEELFFIDEDATLFQFDYRNRIAETITSVKQFQKRGPVIAVVRFNDDYYIAFKTGGLWCLRNSSGEEVWEEIPINCGIFTLLKDKYQNIIWIATDGKGVYSYSHDEYSISSTLSTDISKTLGRPMRCMHIENGNLWIGFKGDGIVKIDNYTPRTDLRYANIRQFTTSNSKLSDNSIFAFEPGDNDILWIGHHDGLNYYACRQRAMEKITLMYDGEVVKFVHDIYQQGAYLWIASAGMGVFKAKIEWEGDTPRLTVLKRFVLDDGAFYSNGWFSFFADEDEIYVANRGKGVMKIDTRDDSYTMIRFDDLIPNKTVNDTFCISKDDAGNYLVGTGLGLVIYYPDGKYELLNRTNGFPENVIRGMMKVENNRFWLATNHGLINFDSNTRIFSKFGVSYGLSVSEFSDAAQYRTDDGENILFGGVNGFVSVRGNLRNSPDAYMPKIQFDRLSILGTDYGLDEFMTGTRQQNLLELTYKQNVFSMSFVAIDYLNGHNQSYFYQLEGGGNEQWINNSNSNTVSFTNISPGTYKLHVKYYNGATNRESEVATFQITISPPWYLSNLATGIYILLITTCLVLFVYYLMARSSRRHVAVMQKLEQQHKAEVYESKLSFFTNIAHEFCTPLSLIYGPVNQIIKTKSIDPSTLRYAGLIKNNAERLNSLITDLIEFRLVETGHKTPKIAPINVSAIAEEAMAGFAEMASTQRFQLIAEIENSIEWNSDRSFITTILNNFISSAIKYADRGGVVKLNVEAKENMLGITISYTGKGIDKKMLTGLFDSYRILDNLEHDPNAELNSRDGLALAISYNLVLLLQGDIRVESQPGRWTHFYVSLPRIEATDPTPDNLFNRGTIALGKESAHIPIGLPKLIFNDSKLTMTVIDNEPEMLWFMTDLFSDKFNVLCLDNIPHMDAVFNNSYPDIIICNSMMQNLDILDLTRYIKSNPNTSHIPLIIISPKQEIEYQISVLGAGAELYIPMPFNVDYLRTSVEKLLRHKEELKEYFTSNISAFELIDGKLIHKSQRKLLKDIIAIINKNIGNKELSAEFIAAQMNMGMRKLYRQVEEIKGIGISGLIRECRLWVASDLLIKTRHTIDEIAFKSGFSNRVSFYKSFTKKYNCTPKEYRDQNSKVG